MWKPCALKQNGGRRWGGFLRIQSVWVIILLNSDKISLPSLVAGNYELLIWTHASASISHWSVWINGCSRLCSVSFQGQRLSVPHSHNPGTLKVSSSLCLNRARGGKESGQSYPCSWSSSDGIAHQHHQPCAAPQDTGVLWTHVILCSHISLSGKNKLLPLTSSVPCTRSPISHPSMLHFKRERTELSYGPRLYNQHMTGQDLKRCSTRSPHTFYFWACCLFLWQTLHIPISGHTVIKIRMPGIPLGYNAVPQAHLMCSP